MKTNRSKTIPFIICGIGAAFIVYGIFRGEAYTIFEKAVSICLECIGIG